MKENGFKVLLINCNTMMDVLLPVGLSLISACLKEKGFKVKLFDTTFYKTTKETGDEIRAKTLQVRKTDPNNFGLTYKDTDIFEDLEKMVEEYTPDIIGLSCIECTYKLGIEMLRSLRQFNIPVIVGGVYATFAPENIITEDCVDMVCVGEGEYALVELCTKLQNKQDITSIQNIWSKKDGNIIKNTIRGPVNLEELPFQDWSIFDPQRFYKPMGGKISMTGTFEMNRGCPYNCRFCSDYGLNKLYADIGGGYYREKSIKRLIDEMKEKKEEYNLEFAYLVAESFLTTKRERIVEFVERYKEVNIPFWIEARPESINEDNIKLLEAAGCEGISLGIESGNLNLRRNLLGRNMTDEILIKAFGILERSSLRISANNIIGFPTETREQIFETIELNRKINVPGVMCSLYNPYKGTALREFCEEEGLIEEKALAGDYRSDMVLNMPQLSKQELLGLQRTFPLYVKFPKSEWPKIKQCEGNGPEAEALFIELSRTYTEKFL